MSSLALDSSIIIRHMRKANAEIAASLKAASELYVPLTALGEIYYGINRSGNDARAVEQWRRFSQSVVILYPDEATAVAYAEIKMHLEIKGKRIPDNDMWIAATAKSFDLPLYCRDGHFDELKEIMTIMQGPNL
jgi:tRNA(fMet)-specific endonuclease VapC